MRFNLNFEYDKLHLKEVTILIPKYHTNMVSFLTPILGLYGINVKEFINDFEVKTKFINFDIVVPTKVRISKIKTFEILLKTPYVVSLLSNVQDFSISKPSNLTILSIYKLSLIKSVFRSTFVNNLHKKVYRSIRKYLSLVLVKSSSFISLNVPVLRFFEKKDYIRSLKLKVFSFVLFKHFVFQRYGVFLTFNNPSSSILNYLNTSLSLLNLSLKKLNTNFMYSLSKLKFFFGSAFYLSSYSWNYFFNFAKDLVLKRFTNNFFPLYFRFNNNLMHIDFFKLFVLNFNAVRNFLYIYLLKIIYRHVIKLLLTINYLNSKLVFLLNYRYKNANLSSNLA